MTSVTEVEQVPEHEVAGLKRAVTVELLGSLRLVVGEAAVDVPGPKRRAVLALLALAEGRTVGIDDLVAALWPSEAPASARSTLQSHVSRLRKHLGAAADRLEGVDAGYRLALDDGALDVTRARTLLRKAREVDGGDPARACELLVEARALWRGTVLPDLVDVVPIASRVTALAELRREIDDLLVACLLGAGRVDDAVARSTEALADDPLREPIVLLAMRALAAVGRSPDALRTAHEFRRRLADESGLEASPALGALEREIAQGHGAGAAEAPASPPRAPSPATAIVGRDSEIAALRRLLADERLVTVVGPGGVGKTRLALELARRSDAPTVLMLAPVTDPAAIPDALAECLGLRITHGDVLRACIALLGSGPRILIVDNCEHVLDAARDLVAALLADCAELTILATSREPLGLAPETLCRLAPLALPAAGAIELDRVPSVAVFVDRARRVRPDFTPDADELRRVGEIVRRLDGMPLAIELAAGRLSSFGLEDLHDRIGRSFDILGDGRASPDARHRTLRTTVQWSYDLLPDDEARFFCHLAVFPDGVDLPTAEAVAADLGIADAPTALAHLVDASILDAEFGETVRYRMLEMLRAFGIAQLESAGELAAAEEWLLRWAVALVEQMNRRSITDDEPENHRQLRREIRTLRAAWHLARRAEHLDHAVALVVNLEYPVYGTDLTETMRWAIELVDDDAVRSHPDYGTVVGMAAANLWLSGDLARADALARQGLAVVNDNTGLWWCHSAMSGVNLMSGRFDEAVTHALEAVSRSQTPAEDYVMAALGSLYGGRASPARAFAQLASAVASCPSQRGLAAYTVGEIESANGNRELAEEHYLRAIELATEGGATFTRGVASVGLVTVLTASGRIDDALSGYCELIDYFERTGTWTQLWTTLRNLATLLRSLDDAETAAFLDTAADVAPESSEVNAEVWEAHQADAPLAPATIARIRKEAASASRADVLELARTSIERHRSN